MLFIAEMQACGMRHPDDLLHKRVTCAKLLGDKRASVGESRNEIKEGQVGSLAERIPQKFKKV